MSAGRLFGIVYHLLEKGKATAPALAQKFEVSVRTIYRDIDALSSAGIPVYTLQGKGGGIALLPGYTLEKSLLSAEEQQQLLAALQGMTVAADGSADTLLAKLRGLFGLKAADWIEVDFSGWGQDALQQDTFSVIRQAILQRHVLTFVYFGGASGEPRKVRPVRLVFKSRDWYVYAFCLSRKAYRFFKLTRIRQPVMLPETFAPADIPAKVEKQLPAEKTVTVELKFDRRAAFRVYDEFAEGVRTEADGSLYVKTALPDSEALYLYILSFAQTAEIVGPPHIREQMKNRLRQMLENYG